VSNHTSNHTSNHASKRAPVWDLGSTGVKALAAFAILVAVLAAVLAWHGRPTIVPVAPAPAPATVGLRSTQPATIVVAVSGRVRHPGLVRLPAGARVADAIDAAGGVLPGTDTSALNLARKLTDGELVAVGVPGASAPAAGGGVPGGSGAPGGPVNLNTATLEQLETLPGVGPVLAQRIIDYRDQHGGFTSVDQLRQVSGIGDAKFNDLKNRVSV
jgi:competence protein ComEA